MAKKKEIHKMQWFVDSFHAGTLPGIVKNSGRVRGIICMPTGTGKSGVLYDHLVTTVNDFTEGLIKKEKLILHLCTPNLKLCQQLVRDLLWPISKLCSEEIRDTMICYVNSSDKVDQYKLHDEEIGIDFAEEGERVKGFFNQHPNKKIAIVISCFPSVHYFNSSIKADPLFKELAHVVTYVDECHEFYSHKTETDGEFIEKDVVPLCEVSNQIFGFTATPAPDITRIITGDHPKLGTKEEYVYMYEANDAINNNDILPPGVFYKVIENTADMKAEDLIEIMKFAKSQLSRIHHKILVSCNNTNKVIELRDKLSDLGYKVFSTTSNEGMKVTNEDSEEVIDGSISEFTKSIDEYDGDCFVLHIRQLIRGIDIKNLTDCVILADKSYTASERRTLYQTIGRCIRIGEGDRSEKTGKGKPIKFRKKKFGGVYFLTPRENEEQFINATQKEVCGYYGIYDYELFNDNYERGPVNKVSLIEDEIQADLNNKNFGIIQAEHTAPVRTLYVNIHEEIKEGVKRSFTHTVQYNERYRKTDKEIVDEIISSLQQKKFIMDMSDTATYLTNASLIKQIKEEIKIQKRSLGYELF